MSKHLSHLFVFDHPWYFLSKRLNGYSQCQNVPGKSFILKDRSEPKIIRKPQGYHLRLTLPSSVIGKSLDYSKIRKNPSKSGLFQVIECSIFVRTKMTIILLKLYKKKKLDQVEVRQGKG